MSLDLIWTQNLADHVRMLGRRDLIEKVQCVWLKESDIGVLPLNKLHHFTAQLGILAALAVEITF